MRNATGLKVRTIAILSTISVAILLLTSLFPLVYAAVPWTKDPGELSLKEDVIYDELFVIDSWVVKNSDTDYEMWYTHSRTDMGISQLESNITAILSDGLISALISLDLAGLLDEMALINPTDLWNFLTATTTVIGYATSTDGMNWNVVDDEVLAGTAGEWENFGAPCVIKNDVDDYEMWFTHSADTSLTADNIDDILLDLGSTDTATVRDAMIALINSTSSTIGYATSSNGIEWGTPTPSVFGDSGGGVWDIVAAPCVIKNGTDDYEMWYTYADTSLNTDDLDTILHPDNIGDFDSGDLWDILNSIDSVIGYATYDGLDWTIVNPSVISNGSGLWNGVATPCVIKNGGVYEIWYSSFTTDLDSTEFGNLFTDLQTLGPDILSLWGSFASGDLNTFLLDFDAFFGVSGPFDSIRPYLDDTATRISYATSLDGETWTTQNPAALVGNSGSPWSSVAFPCVVWEDGVYEMWFTQGVEFLTAQNIVSLLDGTNLPIGYATAMESIDLVSGWNLMGLPLNPTSSATEDVLVGILNNVVIVWANDATTGNWSSFYYNPLTSQWTGTLTEMTVGKGYWIEMTVVTNLVISGVSPSLPFSIDLVEGWNLISIPEPTGSSATAEILADILNNVVIVWANDATTGNWSSFYYNPLTSQWTGTLTEMTAGKGYWIEMTADDTLIIN
ncbi:hypothetical protein ACFLUX_01145 [Chloroflexota bacterium]